MSAHLRSSLSPRARSGGSWALQSPSLRFVGPMVLPTSWGTVHPVTDYGGVHGNCHLDLIWVTSDLPLGKMRLRFLQHRSSMFPPPNPISFAPQQVLIHRALLKSPCGTQVSIGILFPGSLICSTKEVKLQGWSQTVLY